MPMSISEQGDGKGEAIVISFTEVNKQGTACMGKGETHGDEVAGGDLVGCIGSHSANHGCESTSYPACCVQPHWVSTQI